VKKTTLKNRISNPYAKSSSTKIQNLKENPTPILTPAMAYNSQQPLRKFPQSEKDKNEEMDKIVKEQNISKESAKVKEKKNMEIGLKEQEKENNPGTSRLDQLDLSYLTEKQIEPVKRSNKAERLKELKEVRIGEEGKD